MLTSDDFRLRNGDEIVGYRREIGNYTLFSKSLYFWNGSPIEFLQQDKCTGYKDRNDKWLFEKDIITSTDHPSKSYIITYDSLLTKFLLVDYFEGLIFDHSVEDFLADKRKIRWVTYEFINSI
ncbi:MAG: hypothetical protein R3277_03150 [Brumimicrobium sp.]|nr:hypothetical protein [Brumimicrobium sp.]